jgi:hypothetical protein
VYLSGKTVEARYRKWMVLPYLEFDRPFIGIFDDFCS